MNKPLIRVFPLIVFLLNVVCAQGWPEITGQAVEPNLVAFSNCESPPGALPFITERKEQAGFWTSFGDANVIGKIGQTTVKPEADLPWQDTGLWMHVRTDSDWVSLPVSESAGAAAGAVKKDDGYLAFHATFWKSLQASRPAARESDATAEKSEVKTGSFTINLGDYQGTAMTPDDRKVNPFYEYNGDPSKEEANIVVPSDYDGSKPFGLMVFVTPDARGGSKIPKWGSDLADEQIIWIGALKTGNNERGERRVWLAQQARAWALHHYKIDPNRMIIAGLSNGADAASATAVATPFGFNSAMLFCPPSGPPVGTVIVPIEDQNGKLSGVVYIKPLSATGLSHIKRTWRIAHIVGANDQFLSNVRASAKQVENFDMGAKLYEIPDLGHSMPGSIKEHLAFIDAPRDAEPGATEGFSPDSYLRDIRQALSSSPQKGREAMSQLWQNHPAARSHPDVLALLEEMEKVP